MGALVAAPCYVPHVWSVDQFLEIAADALRVFRARARARDTLRDGEVYLGSSRL